MEAPSPMAAIARIVPLLSLMLLATAATAHGASQFHTPEERRLAVFKQNLESRIDSRIASIELRASHSHLHQSAAQGQGISLTTLGSQQNQAGDSLIGSLTALKAK